MMKKLTAIITTLISILTLTACSKVKDISSGVELPHYDGVSIKEDDRSYDSSLFYRNDLTIFGGDSDVIWVSEEQGGEEYGGYFYQYTSGNGGMTTKWLEGQSNGSTSFAISCLRSKDLNDWELCGAYRNGFSIKLEYDDWVKDYCWAPEVIYDDVGKFYYMYFSAMPFDRKAEDITYKLPFNICVYRSQTPVGPFELVTSESYYGQDGQKNEDGKVVNLNGEVITKRNPQIDFAKYFNLPYAYPVIDLSPFKASDGKLYLYFSKEYLDASGKKYDYKDENGDWYHYDVLSIWVMEMKDYLTPNYETMRMVAYPGYKSVRYKGANGQEVNDPNFPIYKDSSYELIGYSENEDKDDDGTINEGAQVLEHKSADGVTRYYLTYSQTGFDARDYGVHQSVSESPFGPFVKLGRNYSAFGVSVENDYMTGVGHHAYCEANGELFGIYWVHADPNDTSTAKNGRIYAFDRQFFSYDDRFGFDVLYGNGPTKSLQLKPSVSIGYKNVADQAKITVSNGNAETVKWLNDKMFTVLDSYYDREFEFEGDSVITLKFDQPKDIRGIMIYNSADYDYAFSKIDNIVFKLAEKPTFYDIDFYNGHLYIKDLPFNKNYYNEVDGFMRQGGSSVASFNEIKVEEIKIQISEKLNKKSDNSKIKISEIYVIGK